MKLSTVKAIFWAAVLVFWALQIGDIATPGKAPAALEIIQKVSLFALTAAHFYSWGANRSPSKTTTNEKSI